ncbi:protein kinase domain-containing protein [Kribbella sp. NPDC054772]
MTDRTLANGRYVLNEPPLGVGGMGTVWKAFDTVLHREVAVKELRIPDGLNPEEQEKLRMRAVREARAAAGLDHPAIVTIHDVVDEAGSPWIVMRLLPGRTLDQAVRTNGPLNPRRAAELGVRLIEALTAAHANGVLHRDVKPQNVMLGGDDRWMLTDFGIASVAGATRTLTGTGLVTGTLGYVAPERLSGAEPGAPADLWALGATLYYAVEGRHAYDFDDLPAMIGAVLTRDPEPMRLAGRLAPVIVGLMQRDPARRLDARTAREQLLAIAGGYPTFENPTVVADNNKSTDKVRSGTKLMNEPPERVVPEDFPQLDSGVRVLRALRALLFALNAAVGAFTALLVYSLSDGMPVWILAALGLVCAAGAALGAQVTPRLARWIGLPTALSGTALVTGEAMAGGGLVVVPQLPIATIILFGIALLAFAICQRLCKAARRRLVPAEELKRATRKVRWLGFAAFLFGALAAGGFLGFIEENRHDFRDFNYVEAILAAGGVLIVLTALLTIPAIRGAQTPNDRRPPPAVLVPAAVVIPVVVAIVWGIGFVARLNDFTSTPDTCGSAILSDKRVQAVLGGSGGEDGYDGDDYVRCSWENLDGDSSTELEVDVDRYDGVAEAKQVMQRHRTRTTVDGKSHAELQLGDESFRRGYAGSIASHDSTGLSVEVRIENVVLEVTLEHGEDLDSPDPAKVEALADELSREIKSQQP